MHNRILLVEDDPGDQELILLALKDNNIINEVVLAEDGQEALDYIFGEGKYSGRDVRDSPTVMLLDLHLPRVEGLEVLKRVRSDVRTKRQPVVILTSSGEDKDRLAGYDLGVNSYVQKPVNYDDFGRAVKELRLYWLLLNSPPPGS